MERNMKSSLTSLLVLCLLITSCAHRPLAYDESTFDPTKEGIFYGTIKVDLDNKLASEQCDLHFSDDKSIYITPIKNDGTFKLAGPDGEMFLKGIKCNSDFFTFEDKALSFKNKVGAKPTFIGDFEVKWETGGFNPFITVGALLIGWIAVSRSAHKLTIVNKSLASRSYASTNDFRKSLIKIPYGLNPNHIK